jgi:hypothetical protein
MNNIPESDKKLISELQLLLDQLDAKRRGLYTRRPGCSCKEDHLCALHAAVWNYLQGASDEIARAIKYLESEG